jgi:hypothetical protein
MKAYVIKDSNGSPVASTFFEPQAMTYCQENEGCTYTLLPFILEEGVTLEMINHNRVTEPIHVDIWDSKPKPKKEPISYFQKLHEIEANKNKS